MRPLTRPLVGAGVLTLLTAGGYAAADRGTPHGATAGDLCGLGSCHDATVNRVIDGDTLDVDTEGSTQCVRVLGIDTPETKKAGEPVACFGPEATERSTELLPHGASITLVVDDEADTIDDYGRELRHVLTEGGNVGEMLVAEGYATNTTFPHSLEDLYQTAEHDAHGARSGLWGACLAAG